MIGTTPASSSAAKRVARVVGARAIGQIGVREEDLRHGELVPSERLFVEAHEDALPRRGRGLEERHVACGRADRPSFFVPSAMAPLETMTTLRLLVVGIAYGVRQAIVDRGLGGRARASRS